MRLAEHVKIHPGTGLKFLIFGMAVAFGVLVASLQHAAQLDADAALPLLIFVMGAR